MNNFISYKKDISDFLINFLELKQTELKASAFTIDVLLRIKPLAISGKMLRGSLLINVYEKLSNQKYSKEALQAAVSLELIGTSLLIHDDIIDQDELRRGHQTLHTQYQQLSGSRKYGESFAICAGDLGIFMAQELLSGGLVKLFSKQLSKTILGEMQDVDFANRPNVTKDEILQMYLDKTASYTVSLPLMAGAALASQNEKIVRQLNDLGKTLGLIFQIKDDELGLFGDETKIGKPVGADIREGKKTLYYYYLEQVVPNAFADNGVEEVSELMKKHQITEQVNKDLGELETKAKEQIEKLESADLKKMLLKFLGVNLTRSR